MSKLQSRHARLPVLPVFLAPVLVACAAAGPTTGTHRGHNHDHERLAGGHSHDLTNRVLTNRSGDCADYAATYTAEPRDIQRRRDHAAVRYRSQPMDRSARSPLTLCLTMISTHKGPGL